MLKRWMKLFFRAARTVLAGTAQRRAQARQLREMSDLDLRDLGVGRSEIPALLSGGQVRHNEDRRGNRRPG